MQTLSSLSAQQDSWLSLVMSNIWLTDFTKAHKPQDHVCVLPLTHKDNFSMLLSTESEFLSLTKHMVSFNSHFKPSLLVTFNHFGYFRRPKTRGIGLNSCNRSQVQGSEVVGPSEFQDVYDHAGRTFTLLGDSDRARCHSRFHQAFTGLRARSTKER